MRRNRTKIQKIGRQIPPLIKYKDKDKIGGVTLYYIIFAHSIVPLRCISCLLAPFAIFLPSFAMAFSIQQRLLQADEAFLTALDTLELQEFQVVWNKLAGDIVKAVNAGQISKKDLSLARVVSSRVRILDGIFSEFTQECDSIILSSEQELESIAERHGRDRQRSPSHTSDNPPETSSSPYIKQAYAWLIANTFNPYPSKQTREDIARDACCDPRHVENWFADVRKRIGWNTMRRRHFSNKRSLVVAAATAFFQEKESNLLTDTSRLDFANLLQRVRELYAGKFTVSELAQSITNGKNRKSGRDSTPSDSDVAAFSTSSLYLSPRVDWTGGAQLVNSSDNLGLSSSKRKRKRCRSPDCDRPSSPQSTQKRIRYVIIHWARGFVTDFEKVERRM